MRKTDQPKQQPSQSPLCKRIEIERIGSAPQDAYSLNKEGAPTGFGIDPSVIRHIEELLEEIELQEYKSAPPQNVDEDFTSVFKKVVDIERKLKRFAAESLALKKLLQRLN
jgi:hypothetical protein